MINKSEWLNIIPDEDLRPDSKRVKQLEKLRRRYDIPHEALAMRVISSVATTRKVQKQTYKILRMNHPDISEKELLKKLLHSRFQGSALKNMEAISELEKGITNIKTMDEFCDYVISIEEDEFQTDPDPFGIGREIDEILLQEEIEAKAPANNLIKSLTDSYLNLKNQNPDRDNHWLLANTWLKRYGNTQQSKQLGKEKINFIAYKDTLNYSVLSYPDSIRALSLFLVYKELGEEQAKYFVTEFNLLYEKVIKYREESLFIEQYKLINPRTWSENQGEAHSQYTIANLLATTRWMEGNELL